MKIAKSPGSPQENPRKSPGSPFSVVTGLVVRIVWYPFFSCSPLYCTFDLSWQPGPWKSRILRRSLTDSIVWQVKKIRNPTWGVVWWLLLAEIIWLIVVYILHISYSSVFCLLSNLNFELLLSVTFYVYLCTRVPCVDDSWQRMNETHDEIWLTCH